MDWRCMPNNIQAFKPRKMKTQKASNFVQDLFLFNIDCNVNGFELGTGKQRCKKGWNVGKKFPESIRAGRNILEDY